MTLSEYITAEFGIVPDDVQLEQIREVVSKELMAKITREKTKSVLEMNTFTPYPINKDF